MKGDFQTHFQVLQSASLANAQLGVEQGTATLVPSADGLASTAIPEPSTYALVLGLTVLGLVAIRRGKRLVS